MKKQLISLIILIAGLFLIVNLTRSIKELLDAGNRTKEAENQLAELKNQNDNLKKNLSEVESPSYLEKMAREKLGLAREGEVVVIMPSPQETVSSVISQENLPNWKKWLSLFL